MKKNHQNISFKIGDGDFKKLSHSCHSFKIFTNGQELGVGYKPDCVLMKEKEYIILECETKTDRKAYLGAMIKAAHFLRGKRQGTMVFVIMESENTTAKAIANHLSIYLKWIHSKTNLRNVYVIATHHYYPNSVIIELMSKEFLSAAIKVPI